MLTVLGGLAEFERELIRARTGEGCTRAKARGVRFGRPRKMTPHLNGRKRCSVFMLARRWLKSLVPMPSMARPSRGWRYPALSRQARPTCEAWAAIIKKTGAWSLMAKVAKAACGCWLPGMRAVAPLLVCSLLLVSSLQFCCFVF